MRLDRSRILWLLFAVNVSTTLASRVPELVHYAWPLGSCSLLALLVLHLGWTLGARRAAGFALFAAFVSGGAELVGMHHSLLFGSRYVYRPDPSAVFGLPLYIIAYWAVFLYTGYCLVTSYRYWLGRDKPARGRCSVGELIFTVACDGVVVLLIDVLLDPIAVRAGYWTWLEAGPFYGVPLGNFRGWFLVACIVTGALRTLEYLRPRPEPAISRSVYVIPVVGYATLALSLYGQACELGLRDLALWCTQISLSVAFGNLALYARWRTSLARTTLAS